MRKKIEPIDKQNGKPSRKLFNLETKQVIHIQIHTLNFSNLHISGYKENEFFFISHLLRKTCWYVSYSEDGGIVASSSVEPAVIRQLDGHACL